MSKCLAQSESSPEQRCIEELITFAIIYAEKHKRDFKLASFHPIQLAIIERAMALIGEDTRIRPYWREQRQ